MVSGTSSRGKLPTAEGRRPISSRMGAGKGEIFFYSLSEKPEVMEAEHVKTLMVFFCLQKCEPSVPLPCVPFLLSRSPGIMYAS